MIVGVDVTNSGSDRGLQQFRVRGLAKVKAVTLWYALTFNFLRMVNLGCIE